VKRATVAIVGRPNVGKSTLFNRLVGRRDAIVSERPGVTRDRHFSPASWRGKEFWLVDTGGWIPGKGDTVTEAIRRHVERAIAEAELVLLVVDCREGPQPVDQEIARILRPCGERVMLVANKADDLPRTTSHHSFYSLGLGQPVPVSAASGKGTGDLLDQIVSRLPAVDRALPEPDAIQVAVVGRPNVGKSSLVNRLLGEERSIVTPEPGTTRDPVDALLRYRGRMLNFIDTAGLRRRSKVIDEIEFYAALRTERAIDRADVCVLVVDATQGVQSQDVRIARRALQHGCGLIVAVNKWDLIADKDAGTAARGERAVKERIAELQAIPFVYVSALTGLRVRKILDLVLSLAEQRERRVATGEVNRVLRQLVERNQPPQKAGREVKLFYASQIGVAPPTFAVVANWPDDIPESYRRYLVRGFREAWGFEGVPIWIRFKKRRSKGARQD
jgi:GTP-binding protein